MHEAMLYEKLPNSRVRCNTCQWHCKIGPDKYGVCGMYQNRGGGLYNLNYAKVSSVAADPIEKKPLFHFFPNTLAFSLGTLGCNFHCKHCQNWEISSADSSAVWHGCREIQPQTAIELAKGYHCQGIAWTYNEPAVWFEYTLDSAKLAKENNLYTVYVTNGYSTPEALDTIGPYLDAWRVDIKGFSDAFYRELAKVPHWREILEVAKRAKAKWKMHVEVVTNIIPTMNDDDQQLEGIANWIRGELGELTPWHVTRFYPHHHMMHLPPTPVATLERAYEIGRKAGLKFVYAGNVPGHQSENTTCYSCGKLNVQRFGYQTKVVGMEDSRCKFCGAELNFKTLGARRGKMIRNPVVAGQFYPASASQLKAMIEMLVDEKAEKQEVIGVVSPHAGYVYSGPVAGAVISRIKFKDTFIIMGPSHTGMGKPFSIMTEGVWKTPLGEVEIDSELSKQILAKSGYLQEDHSAHQHEHSIEVQIPFLQYFKPDIRIVPIVLSPASGATYKEIGKEIARAIKELNTEVVIMASSDMTHYEPHELAKKKDTQAIDAILELNEDELLKRVEELNISMCGYAPTVSLISAAKELGAKGAELVRYQTSGDTTGDYSSVVGYAGIIIKAIEMHPLVKLAKKTVETYVKKGKIPKPEELTPEMKEKAGVFVSIHKLGELRGCIGTFEPTKKNVAEEIINNAISSATRDPRFPPIAPEELKDLDYSVDVLTTPEPVADKSQLDPKKYGVIVERGFRRGLLLPDLEGVDTVDYQIDICRQKAGIAPDEPVKLYRFEVKRYK